MPKSRWATILIALLVIAAGLVPMLAALKVIPSPDVSFHAPRWVVFLAGSLFFVVGMWLMLQPLAGQAVANAFGAAVGPITLLGLALIANWIAFGSGTREGCGGGASLSGVSLWSDAPELECRAAFGYGAVLLDVMLLKGLSAWAAKRRPANLPLRFLDKALHWMVAGVLLPLFLLAVLVSGARNGGGWIARRMRGDESAGPPPG